MREARTSSPRRALVSRDVLSPTVGATFTLPDDVAAYFGRALRLRDGTSVELFDGEGARVTAVLERNVSAARVVEVGHVPPPNFRAVIAQAAIKAAKLEEVVRHGTECGASSFIVFNAERTTVDARQSRGQKRERLVGIAADATRQSLRAYRPNLELGWAFTELVDEVKQFSGTVVYGDPSVSTPFSVALADMVLPVDVMVIIGPEGGLDAREMTTLQDAGARPVRLGLFVARTETASNLALAAVQARAGWL